jgi:hypothetical protein
MPPETSSVSVSPACLRKAGQAGGAGQKRAEQDASRSTARRSLVRRRDRTDLGCDLKARQREHLERPGDVERLRTVVDQHADGAWAIEEHCSAKKS